MRLIALPVLGLAVLALPVLALLGLACSLPQPSTRSTSAAGDSAARTGQDGAHLTLQDTTGLTLRDRIDLTLSRHIEGQAIGAWFARLEEGGLEREAAALILAWLPTSDLATLDLALLKEHVDVAARSYREAPWRDRLPYEIWLRYVAPHRVSQEPLQHWRGFLHDRLWPIVKDIESMELAALAVNRWCREQVTFISTSGRDMGPLTTLKRGLGRCEEEMILAISALRSVGIPARSCATPYWPFRDNNHAWVEVWADGQWYYAESCNAPRCLNKTWFGRSARRGGFVRSVAYGEFVPEDEPLYRAEKGSTLINSTHVYTNPFLLTATVEDSPEADIYVNVFNFGALRPIAKLRSGTSIEVGAGEYALTAEVDGELLWKIIQGRPGGDTRAILRASDRYDFAISPGFWLRYSEADAAPARDVNLVTDEEMRLHKLRVGARKEDRAKLHSLSESETAARDSLSEKDKKRLDTILEKPMERVSLIFLLLDWFCDIEQREALLAFLELADDKDLLQLDEAAIRAHLDGALAVRHRLEPLGLSVPESLFVANILANRIHRERACDWRSPLPLIELGKDAQSSLERLLAEFRDHVEEVEGGFFGNPMPPQDVWRLGLGTEKDLAVALVGLCRRNGFPARYRNDKVEIWLGEFIRVNPLADNQQEASEERAVEMGTLVIEITRGGLPYARAESYREFMVSRVKEGHLSSPWWDPVLGPQAWDSGDYVLCAVLRVPDGSVHARMRAFHVEPGKETRVSLPVDIDPSGWDPSNLITGASVEATIQALEDCGSQIRSSGTATGRPLPGTGLFFLFEPGEPATRMITALGGLVDRLAQESIQFIPVLVGDGEAQDWSQKLAEAGLEVPLRLDSSGCLRALPEQDAVFEPLTILIVEEEGEQKVQLLRKGLDTTIDATVHLALDFLAAPEGSVR
ncbi:MAG: transglutaminase domain-containing protein [Candidatus Eisenbacteria sp.]|nr:transglutaminase domain-containing protein [Candidatus Eisenbacteria bacterium]